MPPLSRRSFTKNAAAAVYCHISQKPDEIYNATDCNHALMEKFRGAEKGVTAAEAFTKFNGSHNHDF